LPQALRICQLSWWIEILGIQGEKKGSDTAHTERKTCNRDVVTVFARAILEYEHQFVLTAVERSLPAAHFDSDTDIPQL